MRTNSQHDADDLLDTWSHFLISEMNYLVLLGESIIAACQLKPSSKLIIKHALNSDDFATLHRALSLVNMESITQIIDWNDIND
jgi:hypothetical protein